MRKHVESATFSCDSLPAAYNPLIMCSGVVNYPFTVGAGGAEELNSIASTLASGLVNFINTGCLTDMKRYICASVYLPCVPGVIPGDTSTYQMVDVFPGYQVPIPFYRPCG